MISELTQEPNRQSSDGHQGLFQDLQTKHENRQTNLVPYILDIPVLQYIQVQKLQDFQIPS